MKLLPAKAATAFDRPDPKVRFTLLSGADQSTSRLQAQRLLAGLQAEKVAVSSAQLKGDPGWLADEAATLSMFGDRRLFWIEPAGEDVVPAVLALLEAPAVEASAVAIVSAALRKDSGLGKLADAHPLAVHVTNGLLNARDQARHVMELARAEGLTVDAPLAERIAGEANGDLILARLELQKFALYLDATPDRIKALDEEVVQQLGIDQGEADLNRPGDLALTGDLQALASELALLESSGVDPIPVVRALQRRLITLTALKARLAQGQSSDLVMKSVWGRDKVILPQILRQWTPQRLSQVFESVQKLERQLLMQPVPGSAALGELLLQIARAARR